MKTEWWALDLLLNWLVEEYRLPLTSCRVCLADSSRWQQSVTQHLPEQTPRAHVCSLVIFWWSPRNEDGIELVSVDPKLLLQPVSVWYKPPLFVLHLVVCLNAPWLCSGIGDHDNTNCDRLPEACWASEPHTHPHTRSSFLCFHVLFWKSGFLSHLISIYSSSFLVALISSSTQSVAPVFVQETTSPSLCI